MSARRNVGGYSEGDHLLPFRTEKLSPSALMVLPLGGRVGRRQLKLDKGLYRKDAGLLSFSKLPKSKSDKPNRIDSSLIRVNTVIYHRKVGVKGGALISNLQSPLP